MSNGADVNFLNHLGRTPLHLAVMFGREGMVRLLLQELGADVNPVDNLGVTPLHYAARYGHAAIVRLLVNCSADVNALRSLQREPHSNRQFDPSCSQTGTPLHHALMRLRLEVIRRTYRIGHGVLRRQDRPCRHFWHNSVALGCAK